MKEAFQPGYFQIGVEVNLLIRNNPSEWDAFLRLHRNTYAVLKGRYPNLPVGVAVFCVSFFPVPPLPSAALKWLYWKRAMALTLSFI